MSGEGGGAHPLLWLRSGREVKGQWRPEIIPRDLYGAPFSKSPEKAGNNTVIVLRWLFGLFTAVAER